MVTRVLIFEGVAYDPLWRLNVCFIILRSWFLSIQFNAGTSTFVSSFFYSQIFTRDKSYRKYIFIEQKSIWRVKSAYCEHYLMHIKFFSVRLYWKKLFCSYVFPTDWGNASGSFTEDIYYSTILRFKSTSSKLSTKKL